MVDAETGEYSFDSGATARDDTRDAIIEALFGKMQEQGNNSKAKEESKAAIET